MTQNIAPIENAGQVITAPQYKSKLLVCPPDHFQVTRPASAFGAVNDYARAGYEAYAKNPASFRQRARNQWDVLMSAFIRSGIEILEICPREDLPYLVFTADASRSFQIGNDAFSIISKFSNDHRAEESSIHRDYIKEHFPERQIIPSQLNCEGTGDFLYDPFRDLFWAGYTRTPGRKEAASGRSDIRSHELLASKSQTTVVSLEVRRPFFHLDTALAPLSRGHMVVYEGGLDPSSFEELIKKGFTNQNLDTKDYLITVDIEDARKYACNLVCHQNKVFMPECSATLRKQISEKGYEVLCFDVESFILAGGGIHCLTNPINERKCYPSCRL